VIGYFPDSISSGFDFGKIAACSQVTMTRSDKSYEWRYYCMKRVCGAEDKLKRGDKT
jgi:hypothetical protein